MVHYEFKLKLQQTIFTNRKSIYHETKLEPMTIKQEISSDI